MSETQEQPSYPAGSYEHGRQVEADLTRRLMTELENAAAAVRADGQPRTVRVQGPEGTPVTVEVTPALAEEIEKEEWAGYGTSWLETNAQRMVDGLGVNTREIEPDDVSTTTLGVVTGTEEPTAGPTRETKSEPPVETPAETKAA